MQRTTAAILAASVVALELTLSPTVRANGRLPESRLLEHPSDPNRLYMTAPYGLLISHDRGQKWYSICEQGFALDYLEGDTLLELLPDGTLVSGISATGTDGGGQTLLARRASA